MAEKGLINKMEISEQEARRLRLPTTRKQQYWDILKSQFGNLFKINLLSLLMAIPFLVVAFMLMPIMKELVGTQFDFTGNIGIGYPGSISNMMQAEFAVIVSTMHLYLLLIPTVALLGVPFAGMMYCMRNLVWGENITVRIDYWRGIKLGWKQYIAVFAILGVLVAGFMMSLEMYNLQSIMGVVDAWGIIALVMTIIGFVVLAAVCVYMLPMMAMFKMKLTKLIKNSAILSVAIFPYTILMLILTASPFLLAEMFGPSIGMFFYMAIMMIGVSMITLMWTVYVQYVLDLTVNARTKNAAYKRGIYVVKEEPKGDSENEEHSDNKEKKSPAQHRYVNPKKKRKAGPAQPTLRENFNRADIQKMMEEKEKFLDSVDEEDSEESEE